MKVGAIFAVALAGIASQASAETLLLNCQITKAVDADPYNWFAKPPASVEALAKALWTSGIGGFAISPSTTWEITLPSGAIREPESASPFWPTAVVKPASIVGTQYSQSGSAFFFSFNRISNKLTLESWLDETSRREWQAAHGKAFPLIIRYEQQCTVRAV